jgi:hypothetical protein
MLYRMCCIGFYSIFESMETLKKYAVSDEHMKFVLLPFFPTSSSRCGFA